MPTASRSSPATRAPATRTFPVEHRRQLHVLESGERVEQSEVLEDEADGGPTVGGQRIAFEGGDIVTADVERSRLDPLEATDQAEERGLAGTG